MTKQHRADHTSKFELLEHKGLVIIGWREWVCLPNLNIKRIKAKIDTGARTSALHAFDIEEFSDHGRKMVRFKVHPKQRDSSKIVHAIAPLVDKRHVKDSHGGVSHRPVILAQAALGPFTWELELTLVNRDPMGFRMLLGRQALRGRLLVDPHRSYLLGRRKKS